MARRSRAGKTARAARDAQAPAPAPEEPAPAVHDEETSAPPIPAPSSPEADDRGSASFVVDTTSADLPADLALVPSAPVVVEAEGLALPSHVALVTDTDGAASPPPAANGDYEQIDAQGTRYYEAEAQNERRSRGICPVCGEAGHDKKKCPYQQDCPMPRVGPARSRVCERCGEVGHPETTCHTLWRLYTYYEDDEYDAARARLQRHLRRRAERQHEREAKRAKSQRSWAVALVQPNDDTGPSDDSDDDVSSSPPPRDWDPAVRFCYNCAAKGHHWGDDCFLRRTNPTRPTGDPSPFSEAGSRGGPFARASRGLSIRGASAERKRPSLLDDMTRDSDRDWLARRSKLQQRRPPADLDGDDARRPPKRARPAPPWMSKKGRTTPSHRPRSDRPFRPQYRGGYS